MLKCTTPCQDSYVSSKLVKKNLDDKSLCKLDTSLTTIRGAPRVVLNNLNIFNCSAILVHWYRPKVAFYLLKLKNF